MRSKRARVFWLIFQLSILFGSLVISLVVNLPLIFVIGIAVSIILLGINTMGGA